MNSSAESSPRFCPLPGKFYYETHFAPLLRMQGFFDEVALELTGRDATRLPVLVNAVERRDEAGQALAIRITVFNATAGSGLGPVALRPDPMGLG